MRFSDLFYSFKKLIYFKYTNLAVFIPAIHLFYH